MRFSFSFGSSTLSSPSPSSLPPPPPPPSPNDGLLDITPRKSSFSTSLGMSNACAFPSWPNRPSLSLSDSGTVSSYLSDEDLFPDGISTPSSEAVIDEEPAASDPVFGAPDLTTEEQIAMIRAAAEEDERMRRYLAHVHARARAQQALRAAQMAAAENARRKKRRAAVPEKKRRSPSSSSKSEQRS